MAASLRADDFGAAMIVRALFISCGLAHIFFPPSLMGSVCSDCIFLSLILCQRTCTNCTSMDKDWSKSAVLGIDWTAGGQVKSISESRKL